MLGGLYIHVPFCARICPYCDFAVRTGKRHERDAYVRAICREIDTVATDGFAGGVELDTVYFGGGTPSVLTAGQLATILDHARARLPVHDDAWITLEANPEDVDAERAGAWYALGVRTLSLGAQSLVAERLAYLGRSHGPEQVRAAVGAARAAGFPIVSIDLMFGVQGQASRAWQRELADLVALTPEHVSCYQLTFHQGTPFGRALAQGARHEMPDAEQAELYRLVHERLGEAGYAAYEVSNFARAPQFESRHNRKYWDHVPYLGVGPSAHSFDGRRRRWWNHRNLPEYLSAVGSGRRPIDGQEHLSDAELVTEAVMFGLRARLGIDLDGVRERWRVDLGALNADRLARWADAGLIDPAGFDAGRIAPGTMVRPTPAGMAIADRLAAEMRTN